MSAEKLLLHDVDYFTDETGTTIKLFGKINNKPRCLFFPYPPYFYVENVLKGDLQGLKFRDGGEIICVKSVIEEHKKINGSEKPMLKVYCNKPTDISKLRSFISLNFPSSVCHEFDINFRKRFLSDFNLCPLDYVEIECSGDNVESIGKTSEGDAAMNFMAFDIEVFNPGGMPDSNKDQVIMLSFFSQFGKGVLCEKGNKEFVISVESEKAMIQKFMDLLEFYNVDVLVGFNSSAFDIPYILQRARKNKLGNIFSRIKSESIRKIRKGLNTGFDIPGMVHFDLYPIARLFGSMGVISGINKYTLEEVYSGMFNKEKKMVSRHEIWKLWQENDIDELLDYSLGDAASTYEIAGEILPLAVELSKLSKVPLAETALSTAGQFVENLLIANAKKRNEIIPRKPNINDIKQRELNPIEGAFVKLPDPGIYENLAVLDFRGLYPSIIISYNVDPVSVCETSPADENSCHISPDGVRFRKSPSGLIPETLEALIEKRFEIKKKIKSIDKNSLEYKKLSAKSQALKIIANSFYGYLGYARSRWYNRECAASVTSWGRKHIKDAWAKAEEYGFKVLYIDTDSLFLLMGKKTKQDVIAFMNAINMELPGAMELELEGFYKAGLFVSKKTDSKGAKKKYALLSEDKSIKIRGFELVRRDWSKLAKKLQWNVLKIILEEKNKEKAVSIVKEAITKLRKNEIPLEQLTILTRLSKDIKDYEVISPELAAAQKLKKAGRPLSKDMLIEYVISKKGNSISEKATPKELAVDYDAEYYINHQIIPAVMKILKELGVNEDELKSDGRQSSLDSFF